MPNVEPDRPSGMGLLQVASTGEEEQLVAEKRWFFREDWANWRRSIYWAAIAAVAYHLSWTFPASNALVLIYAWALLRLADDCSAGRSFRFGFLAGFLVFAPQLAWFWNIFGAFAVCLWTALSFFTGLFVAMLQMWKTQFGGRYLGIGAAVLWTAIEYFRSELYPLRFSWFTAGSLFSAKAGVIPWGSLGVYGLGFSAFLLAGRTFERCLKAKVGTLCVIALLVHWPWLNPLPIAARGVKVAGIQLEFPPDLQIPKQLDRLLERHPDAQIIVLSEYSFDGPVPKHVREWCRRNGRYLIAGGKEDVVERGKISFRNTAFVIGPDGELVFQQCKSVPIQFFKDGLPAKEQRVWDSPWGKIAVPVCYDLSYRGVTDPFVKDGAEAFIVPFMDVADWGRRQHEQHARVAPIRAREYGVSIFRLGSSGISQNVNAQGKVLAEAGFPGEGEMIAGLLEFRRARLPIDAWLAPMCVFVAVLFLLTGTVRIMKKASSSPALQKSE